MLRITSRTGGTPPWDIHPAGAFADRAIQCFAIWFTSSSVGVVPCAKTDWTGCMKSDAVSHTTANKAEVTSTRCKFPCDKDNFLITCLLVHVCNLVRRARLTHAFLRAHRNALRLTVWPGCDGDSNNEEQASEPEPVNERVNVNLEGGACG